MHPVSPQNPGLMQVASRARSMSKIAQQERMAIASHRAPARRGLLPQVPALRSAFPVPG
jgi:hypothetical protein